MKILDAIVAFVASAFAGTGVGGGGLLVIYLTLVRDTAQLAAQGINLSFFIAGATSAVPIHIKKRNIDPLAVIFIGAFGIIGASAAGSVNGNAPMASTTLTRKQK